MTARHFAKFIVCSLRGRLLVVDDDHFAVDCNLRRPSAFGVSGNEAAASHGADQTAVLTGKENAAILRAIN